MESERGRCECRIRITDVADDATRKGIIDPLVAYNTARTGRHDSRPLIVAIEDDQGHVIGGLWGRTAYDWLFVELLVVPETLRGRGVGSEVMRCAEQEAINRGCHSAWLDTFEFQARGFYERLGYSCFGELRDYPPGSARYFMKKVLVNTAKATTAVSNQRALEQAIAHWNRGELPEYLRLYGPDVVLHGYAGVEPGIASVRRFYEDWWQAFPGSQLVLKDVVSSGDRVACRFVIEGTHAGPFQGVPPSGRPVSVSGFTILRFVEGQCVERWSLVDSLTLLTQIGALGAGRS